MANALTDLTFEAFKTLYVNTFNKMMSYKLTEVGSDFYCTKLAELADAYPEFVEQLEAEAA